MLVLDDIYEELVFKTIWGDSEVNDCDLNADLWKVMRVCELGGDQELEIIIVWNISVSKSDYPLTCLFHNVLRKDWLKRWVELLLDVLKKDWLSESNSVLNDLQELRVGKLDGLKIAVLLHNLDPLVSLRLWINKEWPSLGLG